MIDDHDLFAVYDCDLAISDHGACIVNYKSPCFARKLNEALWISDFENNFKESA